MSTGDRQGPAPSQHWEFRLYVVGGTTRSARALENIRHLCDTYLAGRYQLEVIDLTTHPEAARQAQILAVPTLLRLSPPPVRRIIGDLSPAEELRATLELDDGLPE